MSLSYHRNPDGTVTALRSDGAGGGSARGVVPGSAEARLAESAFALDRLAAEHAFRVWGWRGAVRIDYYGDGPEAIARVTDGGRAVTVRVTALGAKPE